VNGGAITGFRPLPRPENPDKGENLYVEGGGLGFPPFSPFPGPGVVPNADPSTRTARGVLVEGAVVASGLCGSTMTPARGSWWRCGATGTRSLPSRRGPRRKPRTPLGAAAALPAGHSLSGVPLDWCEGVARLAHMTAPNAITPARWATLAVTYRADLAQFLGSTRSRRTVPLLRCTTGVSRRGRDISCAAIGL
jgi:hypothetical protein